MPRKLKLMAAVGGGGPELLAAGILAVAAAILFWTSPHNGDFAWSDAPRHALNGVFVLDLLRAWPIDHPQQFAYDYYIQYPALTILFYPPLMSAIMAVFYAIFGVSHAVAQLSVCAMYFVLAIAVYLLARRWLPSWQALAVSLAFIGAPEVALWGRQVMLDIPALAWMTLAAWAFLRYLDEDRPVWLYATALTLLAALYTKQTTIFLVPALGLTLIYARGMRIVRDRHFWITVVLFAICLLPLVFLTLKFGQVNEASVLGSARQDLPRTSIDAWLYYLRQMPGQLGWLWPLLAAGYLVFVLVTRSGGRRPEPASVFLLLWLVIGYLFFSAIAVREPRHDIPALVPVTLYAILLLHRIAGEGRQVYASIAAISLAVGTFGYTMLFSPVPQVSGYAEAAETMGKIAPEGSIILFSGERDGSFIFDVRATQAAHHFTILRADKLLLRLTIERERGVEDRGFTEKAILDTLSKYGVRYLVMESDFWTDLPSMAALQHVVRSSGKFEELKRIEIAANVHTRDRELRIYRNLGPVSDEPAAISLEIVGIGQSAAGKINKPDCRGRDSSDCR